MRRRKKIQEAQSCSLQSPRVCLIKGAAIETSEFVIGTIHVCFNFFSKNTLLTETRFHLQNTQQEFISIM